MKLLSLLLSSIFYLLSSVHAAAAPPAAESSQGKLPAADGVSTQSEGGGQALKPNVIIVITDDQGYGDLACHGNPVSKPPPWINSTRNPSASPTSTSAPSAPPPVPPS